MCQGRDDHGSGCEGPKQGAAGLLTATVCLGAHPAVLHAHLRVALTLLGTDSARLGADLEQ